MARKISEDKAGILLEQMRSAIAEKHGQELYNDEKPWDPLIEMAVYAATPDLPEPLKFAANREIAQYIHAKKKAVEHSGQGGGVTVFLQSYSGELKVIEGESHAGIGYQDPATDARRPALPAAVDAEDAAGQGK